MSYERDISRLQGKMATCPICGKEHRIEVRKEEATITIKDQLVSYDKYSFYCCNAKEGESEFVPNRLENENLLRARDAYRAQNDLLTSSEIKNIREKYGLSQAEFSTIMGFGEVTITRYETKQIQEKAHDHLLRKFMDDPNWAYGLLKSSQSKFETERYTILCKIFKNVIASSGNEALSRQILENVYNQYDEPSEFNGYTILDIEKTEAIISFFAAMNNLHKVKLMKLLWYTDALSYQECGKAMTGLVYSHNNMGALPVGHRELLSLDNVKSIESFENEDYSLVTVLPNKSLKFEFSNREIAILNKVKEKFASFSGKSISEYMHKEKAYTETHDRDLISFSFAKYIKI